jgi:hypothetical protein
MSLLLRNLELDERLSNHRPIAIALDVFAADVKIALFGNRQHVVGRLGGACGNQAATDQKRAQQFPDRWRVAGDYLPPMMLVPHISPSHFVKYD